jgi:hypothetical protein
MHFQYQVGQNKAHFILGMTLGSAHAPENRMPEKPGGGRACENAVHLAPDSAVGKEIRQHHLKMKYHEICILPRDEYHMSTYFAEALT